MLTPQRFTRGTAKKKNTFEGAAKLIGCRLLAEVWCPAPKNFIAEVLRSKDFSHQNAKMGTCPPVTVDKNDAIGCQKLTQQQQAWVHKGQVALDTAAPLVTVRNRVTGFGIAGAGRVGCAKYGSNPKWRIDVNTRDALRLLPHKVLKDTKIITMNQSCCGGWATNLVMFASTEIW